MAKYDGLIIPRSYNDYINKSDPLGVSQALQLTGVMDDVPTAGSSKPVKSSGLVGLSAVDVVQTGNMHAVTSNAVFENCLEVETVTGTTDVGGGTYIIKKVGKIVTLDIFGCSLPIGTLYTLFTIPQRFRYSRMIIAQGFNGSGSVDRTHMLGYVIDQNGEVNVNTSDMPLESSFPQLHTIWIID